MHDQTKEIPSCIVRGLNDMIASSMGSFALEAAHPNFSADTMDERLKFFQERTKRLRQLRNDFEDEVYGRCTP